MMGPGNSIEIIPVYNGFVVRVPFNGYGIPDVLSSKDVSVMKAMVKEIKKGADPVMERIEDEKQQHSQFADELIGHAVLPMQRDESLFVFSTFSEVIEFLNQRYT